MSSPYIIFNDYDSRSMSGLFITDMPATISAAVNYDSDAVDGYDGSFITRKNLTTTKRSISIALISNSMAADLITLQDKFSGSGHLVMSDDPTRYLNAQIVDSIQWQKKTPTYCTAEISFLCQPYRQLLLESDVTLTAAGLVANQGKAKAAPLIAISCTGNFTLTVNSEAIGIYVFQIGDTTVFIDSQEQEVFNQDGTIRNRFYTGVFPALDPGDNTISWNENVSQVVVTPRSRWLG